MQLLVSAWSSNLVLFPFIVLEILRCFMPFWLEISYSCQFFYLGQRGWAHIPQNMVTHRSNFQKGHPCAETRRLSYKAWKSVPRFDLGAGSSKKGIGQDRFRRGNHVCKVSWWDFQGLRFYRGGGRIFYFPIDFCMGLTTVQRCCAACDTCYILDPSIWIFHLRYLCALSLHNSTNCDPADFINELWLHNLDLSCEN